MLQTPCRPSLNQAASIFTKSFGESAGFVFHDLRFFHSWIGLGLWDNSYTNNKQLWGISFWEGPDLSKHWTAWTFDKERPQVEENTENTFPSRTYITLVLSCIYRNSKMFKTWSSLPWSGPVRRCHESSVEALGSLRNLGKQHAQHGSGGRMAGALRRAQISFRTGCKVIPVMYRAVMQSCAHFRKKLLQIGADTILRPVLSSSMTTSEHPCQDLHLGYFQGKRRHIR